MPGQPDAALRPRAEDLIATYTHGRKTQQRLHADIRLCACDKLARLHRLTFQPHDVRAARIVAPMPLHIDIARVIRALAKGGWVFFARVVRDLARGFEFGLSAGVLQEKRAPTGRDDERLVHQAEIARADEVILPGDTSIAGGRRGTGLQRGQHPLLTKSRPVLTTPAIACKPDDLLHEVPLPDRRAVKLQRLGLRSERHQIDTIRPHDRRAKDRLPAVDHLHHLARLPVQHIIKSRRRAKVQVVSRDGGRADVIDVLRTARALKTPPGF